MDEQEEKGFEKISLPVLLMIEEFPVICASYSRQCKFTVQYLRRCVLLWNWKKSIIIIGNKCRNTTTDQSKYSRCFACQNSSNVAYLVVRNEHWKHHKNWYLDMVKGVSSPVYWSDASLFVETYIILYVTFIGARFTKWSSYF
jgi:hypothetical protein